MNLEHVALERFDKLVAKGELLWRDAPPVILETEPFNVELRVAPSLVKKPVTSHEAKASRSFTDTNPDFSLGLIGEYHRLILNKFCVVRPQFVLHTLELESQNDPLNERDFGAALQALSGLGNGYMVIFNCGAEAGATISHKHLQVLPKSPNVGLLPRIEDHQIEIKDAIDAVPYQVAIEKVPSLQDSKGLHETYTRTLATYSAEGLNSAHNVLLTKRHLLVIPRRNASSAVPPYQIPNAAAMIGLVWCPSDEIAEEWVQMGPLQALEKFGVAKRQ